MENKTCVFFGPNYIGVDRLDSWARLRIENLICEDNVKTFIFGSGGDFERICYQYMCESKYFNEDLEFKVVKCENMTDLEKLIDMCDYCCFYRKIEYRNIYECEGIEINMIEEKLKHLLVYAQERNKNIVYI